MISSESQLLQFLDEQHISYEYVAHPPVFTCDEAERYRPKLGGVSTKNLFLRDKHKRFYLLVTDCTKTIDLKALGGTLGVSKLQLGAEEDLQALLGVTRGAVTALGLVNDTGGRVRLLLDAGIWGGEHFLCHPLVNTATLVLAKRDLERFFELTGHSAEVIEAPSRK